MDYDAELARMHARYERETARPDADGENVTLIIERGAQRLTVDACVGDDEATVLEVEGDGPLRPGDDVELTPAEAEQARGEAEMRLVDREGPPDWYERDPFDARDE